MKIRPMLSATKRCFVQVEEPEEFATEARLLLALKLYEMGKLSTGLAAQVAGVSREAFFFLLGRYGLSPFGETAEELEEDFANARRASHRSSDWRACKRGASSCPGTCC